MVGIDDSACSQAAVDYVRKMRWPVGSRVVVLTVVTAPIGSFGAAHPPEGRAFESALESQRSYQAALAEGALRVLREAGLPAETRVSFGDPREDLVEFARVERADLLVVGSHGRTGLSRLLMGSVAAHVVAHAPCSVLVVKQQPADHDPAPAPSQRATPPVSTSP